MEKLVGLKVQQLLDQLTTAHGTDSVSIARDNIEMHEEFTAKLLQLVDRGSQASAIAMVHQFCPQFDRELLGYEFRLDYIEAIQMDDRETLSRYLREQLEEYNEKLEIAMQDSQSLIQDAKTQADHCS